MRTRRGSRSISAAVLLGIAAAIGFATSVRMAPVPVHCDRYAAAGGSDAAPGTRARPFGTPSRLARALRPGETGCLRGGTYTAGPDGYVLAVTASGRPGAPIVVRSSAGERAKLVGIVTVTHGAHDVRLGHLDVVGTGSANTVKVYGSDVTIEASDISNLGRGESCMILGSTAGGEAVRPVVRGNSFHDCGAKADGNKDHGIYAAQARDGQITGNRFVNPAAYAVQLYPNAQGFRVVGNVADGGPDTVRGGIVIGGDADSASSDNVVEGNVIAYTRSAGVDVSWEGRVGTSNVVRRNCLWETGGIAAGTGLLAEDNVVADPDFNDRAGADYRLDADSGCRRIGRLPAVPIGHPSKSVR